MSKFSDTMAWIDERIPLTNTWNKHVGQYYAPKNFNFWYYFGSLALLVLVIQIVTGIFLTMNYKPDGDLAFKSCLLYTSPSPRDLSTSRMPSSA